MITAGRLPKTAAHVVLVQNQSERAAAMRGKIKIYIFKFIFLIFSYVLFGQTSYLYAATIIVDGMTDDFVFVMVLGELNYGDDKIFDEKIQRYSNGAVIFQSIGGNLSAGLAIGESIRLKGFDTGVAPNSICASACGLAWLGGVTRYMSADSKIGFHAAYIKIDNYEYVSGQANARIGAYLTRLGISKKAIDYMTDKGPSEINFLSINDARNLGIKVKILELNETTTKSPTTTTQPKNQNKSYYYVTGLNPQGDNWLALKSEPDINSQRLRKLQPDTSYRL